MKIRHHLELDDFFVNFHRKLVCHSRNKLDDAFLERLIICHIKNLLRVIAVDFLSVLLMERFIIRIFYKP